MVINRIINDNAILAEDEVMGEVVLVGDDLALDLQEDSEIDIKEADLVFKMKSEEERERLAELLTYVTPEDFELSHSIIQMAEAELGKKLKESVYITLTDHLIFAIDRVRKGISFNNQLLGDLKQYYPKEILIGKEAIKLVKETRYIEMPEDEAGYIALHIANAQSDYGVPLVDTIAKVTDEILKMVNASKNYRIDESTDKYNRFVIHLKFTINRAFSGKMLNDNDEIFFNTIKNQYPEAFSIAMKIFHHLLNEHSLILTDAELTYLTVNIKQVLDTIN